MDRHGCAGFGLALLLLAAAAGDCPAWADGAPQVLQIRQNFQPQVLQIRQNFQPKMLQVSAGAKVTFMNADDVDHNLHLVPPSGPDTDFGVQKPGETRGMSFPAPGEYMVRCSIHPRMKLKVTVH